MTTARVVLARHGESAWNVEERYQGHADSGLTDLGRGQAKRLADWLNEQNWPRPDILGSSDLPRALDTAAPYAESLGLEPVVDARLREVDTGSWTGRLFTEIAAAYPADVAAAARGDDVRRGDGETFAEVRQRVWAALTDLCRRAVEVHEGPGSPFVVAFAHGGTLRVAAAQAAGAPVPGHRFFAPPPNCSVTLLDLDLAREGTNGRLVGYSVPTTVGATASRTE
jgi:probable phosphoglycerate mutase